MGFSSIPNQPVIFDDSVGICPMGTISYSQLLDTNDVTEFQMKHDICAFAFNEIQDNDFSNPGSNWIYGADWAFQTGGTTSLAIKNTGAASSIYQTGVFVVGKRYRIIVDCQSINLVDGSLGFEVTDGVETIGYIEATGENSFYFYANGTDFYITATNGNDSGAFDSASAFELSTNVFVIVSDDTGLVHQVYNPVDNPNNIVFVRDRMNVKVEWGDIGSLVSGRCYFIGICDPCLNTNGQNGLVNGDYEWGNLYWDTTVLESNAQLNYQTVNNQGVVSWFSAVPSNDDARIENSITTLSDSLTYFIEIQLGQVRTTGGIIELTVFCGTNSHTFNLSSSDSYTTISTNVVSNGTTFSILFTTDGTGVNNGVVINKVSLEVPNDDLVSDTPTNDFLYGTHDCSILINMNNHQDAMGFVWDEGDFNPRLRVGARLAPHTDPYIVDRRTHVDSEGDASAYYYQRRKMMVLALHNEPPFIHDFLSLSQGIGHFFIDNDEYFVQEDEYPSIEWNRERTLGKIEILVSSKVQDIELRKTKADNKGGSSASNLRITTSGNQRVTTDGDRRKTN